jgi:hypothetical protein
MSDASNRELDLGSVRVSFPSWRICKSSSNRPALPKRPIALDGPPTLPPAASGAIGLRGDLVRFREDRSADLDRARRAVAAWRKRHPDGSADQLVAELSGQFHPDYGVILRAVLFAVDRHRAREITGVTAGTAR